MDNTGSARTSKLSLIGLGQGDMYRQGTGICFILDPKAFLGHVKREEPWGKEWSFLNGSKTKLPKAAIGKPSYTTNQGTLRLLKTPLTRYVIFIE